VKSLISGFALFFLFCMRQEPMPPELPAALAAPKNVILLIGDGMGLTQVTAGLYANQNHLNLERFPITGLIKTHSSDKLVTDSGAGATAFSCGCKTYNGAIGVYRDGKPCPTLLETAQQRGLACGLVASSSITHATPASFVAHVPQRADMEAIAAYFVKNQPDFFIGGGLKFFEQRADNRNLRQELQGLGYEIADFKQQRLADLTPDPRQPFAWFSAWEEPDNVLNGRDYLPLAAQMAPSFLKRRSPENGFFLMIEGSQIDWACHANDAPRAVAEMLDFDKAIGEVLRFAAADGETLVIVTADHETGGMAIKQGSTMDSLDIQFNSGQHTATMVPVFAFGPGSTAFGGVYENTDIYTRIMRVWGF
jgi:alkaline phosphatase